ncbi:MAG TPA: hypothetical protein VFI15_04775 [Candidatus Limnocylindrales bacterium]|nr:hypothetical protein [Candidatus Limnocylindrales bacterium]
MARIRINPAKHLAKPTPDAKLGHPRFGKGAPTGPSTKPGPSVLKLPVPKVGPA